MDILESATDEAHTYNLLWPEPSTTVPGVRNTQIHAQLLSPTIATRSNFDTNVDEPGAIQLSHIRIFIAQDESSVQLRTLLYDSTISSLNPAQLGLRKLSASASRLGHSASHRRGLSRSSLSVNPESSVSSTGTRYSPLRGQTVMERTQTSKFPQKSLSTLPHSFDDCTDTLLNRLKAQSANVIPEDGPTPTVEKSQLEDELSRACLDCMFGSSAIKQTAATKLHVIPNTARQKVADVPNWRVHWNSQFTSERPPLEGMSPRSEDLQKVMKVDDGLQSVLITRVFSLPSPSEACLSGSELTPQNILDVNRNMSLPSRGMKGGATRVIARPRKMPTYAVAFLIQMPRPTKAEITPANLPPADLGSSAKNSSLPVPQDTPSLCSSLDSDLQKSWLTLDCLSRINSTLSSSDSDEIDYNDLIASHWTALSRALRALQSITISEILDSLREKELASSVSKRQLDLTNLSEDLYSRSRIQLSMDKAKQRVRQALTSRLISTSQASWRIWREEAHWIFQWELKHRRSSFFATFLTASLAVHQEWLVLLGTKFKRRKLTRLRRALNADGLSIDGRTIVVSNDRVAARRLVFLLATFLHSSCRQQGAVSYGSTATTAAKHGFIKSKLPSAQKLQGTALAIPDARCEDDDRPPFSPLLVKKPIRLNEAALSSESDLSKAIKLSLPREVMHEPAHSADSGAFTVTTDVPPSVTMCPISTCTAISDVPLSESVASVGTKRDSCGSLASQMLKENLRATQPINLAQVHGTPLLKKAPFEKFWKGTLGRSSGVRQSLDETSNLHSADAVHNETPATPQVPKRLPSVAEYGPSGNTKSAVAAAPMTIAYPKTRGSHSKLDRDHDLSESTGTSFRLSVNEADGFIDVKVPLSYIESPLGSPNYLMTSPTNSRTMDGSTCASASHHWPGSPPGSSYLDVAGMLDTISPDVHIQAVRPRSTLHSEVRRMMCEESVPPRLPSSSTCGEMNLDSDQWNDVCATIIADTQSWTVRKVTLHRLFRVISSNNETLHRSDSAFGRAMKQKSYRHAATCAGKMCADEIEYHCVAEKFTDELIGMPDEAIAAAIARVLKSDVLDSSATTHVKMKITKSALEQTAAMAVDAEGDLAATGMAKGECTRRVLLAALERIANAAIAEGAASVDPEQVDASTASRSATHEKHSVLHEQLLKWFS